MDTPASSKYMIIDINKNVSYGDDYDTLPTDNEYMMTECLLSFFVIISIILGFVAVRHLCIDSSMRGKNIRLVMYILLLLTKGQIAWLYILLWLLQIDICS
jgi:hypothetical protein